MTKVDLFKNVAIKKLPEEVSRLLEPFIPDLLDTYHNDFETEDARARLEEAEAQAVAYMVQQEHRQKLDAIREEFRKEQEAVWLNFARKRWPDVDKYFILEKGLDSILDDPIFF